LVAFGGPDALLSGKNGAINAAYFIKSFTCIGFFLQSYGAIAVELHCGL
jgi:hypothetical protein